MKIRVFIKVFGKVLPLIVIPIVLIIKLKWEAILPMIIYLQLLMIWAQAEIGLRQHNLFLVEYDPHFDIKIEEIEIRPTGAKGYMMCIYNISKNPAYRINIMRLRPTAANISPTDFKTFISCLPPKGKDVLCSLNEEERKNLNKYQLSFTILCINQFDKLITFNVKFLEDHLLLSPERTQAPGFLLNTFEDIALLFKLAKFR